ncbi:MAG: DoxX family membrane protein [candidate division KSB1 bacterium]|nr:DoxX family membrane protein [candidate division KSB1 bacterium]
MNSTPLSKLQIGALVVMRVAIGWHFLYEGLAKLINPDWTAAGFLSQSKWIFAPLFQWIADTPSVLAVVDQLNTWGLILIGLGLMLGALERIAAVAGVLLLLLYYLSNPPLPGLFYTLPQEGNYLIINKTFVEMTALFVISMLPTSRVIGLDRLVFRSRKS